MAQSGLRKKKHLRVLPLLRSLHSDPRFQALLAKMKLDDWKRKVLADGS
jgi:hypothetical protein